MRLHEITTTHHRPQGKRVGRGISAGQGKTAGRGTKGQKARTGANSNIPRTFEGSSTGMAQRLPKLGGFTSHRIKPVTVNLAIIEKFFDDGAQVTLTSLIEHGIVSVSEATKRGIKIVGASGTTSKKLTFDTSDSKLVVSKKLQPANS